jgi:predicted TIM-barrel enzyme
MPDDGAYGLPSRRKCPGLYGASSLERLPTEIALTEQTRKVKTLRF